MKAMILAAGRGTRMGELTRKQPKPLLQVKGITLLEDKIQRLKAVGIEDIVINVAYLGKQIQAFAGDGSRWGVNVQYSEEYEPLETAGGINRALPLLGDKPFIAVNADIYCEYNFDMLVEHALPRQVLGHLVMVNNPQQHSAGDFSLTSESLLSNSGGMSARLTYSGIALYHPDFIKGYPKRREQFPLLEVFQFYITKHQLSGEHFRGAWDDIGTPERLAAINQI